MALTIGSICLHSGQLCEMMVCAQHDIHMEYHKVYRCIHSIENEHGLVIISTTPFHPPTAVHNWTVSVSCRRLMAGAICSTTYWFDHRLLEGLWFDLLGYSITQTGGEYISEEYHFQLLYRHLANLCMASFLHDLGNY